MTLRISRSRSLPRAALLCLLLAPSLAAATNDPTGTVDTKRRARVDPSPGTPVAEHDHLRNGRTPARA